MKKILCLLTCIFIIGSSNMLYAQPALPTIMGNTCISPDPNVAATVYTVTTNGNPITGIGQLGDIEITTALPVFPFNGVSFQFSARSRNRSRPLTNTCNDYLQALNNHLAVNAINWGFAQGRLSVFYRTPAPAECTQIVDLDIFKTFTLHPPIVGPRCLNVGDTITYSVCNIISGDPNDRIGQDRYFWTGSAANNYDNADWPSGFTFLYRSADGSSITFRVTGLGFANQKLFCRFGQCNNATVSEITFGTVTPRPTIILFNSNQSATINANSPLTDPPTYCLLGGTSQIVLTASPAAGTSGVFTYNLSSNNFSWGFGSLSAPTLNLPNTNGFISQNVFVAQNSGEIYVRTSNGCDTRTDVLQLGRGLTNPPFSITGNTNLGGPSGNCISNSPFPANGIFTLNGQPGNVPITWGFPSGWNIATGTPANGTQITLTAGVNASSGVLTASIGTCASTVQLPIYVRPVNPGPISLTINGVAASGPPFCIPKTSPTLVFTTPASTVATTSYVWNNIPTGWTPLPPSPAGSSITITPNNTTAGTIVVFATSGGGCLSSNSANAVVSYGQATPVIVKNTLPTCSTTLRGLDAKTLAVIGNNASNLRETVTYSINPVATATNYTWSFTSGLVFGTPVTSGTGGSTVTFVCSGVPGSYQVSVTGTATSGGACAQSSQSSVNANVSLGGNSITISPSPTSGTQLAEIYTYDNNVASNSYFWYEIPANFQIGTVSISGNANTMYNNQALPVNSPPRYFGVIATYADGCTNAFTGESIKYAHRSTKNTEKLISNSNRKEASGDKIALQPNPAQNTTTLVLPKGKTMLAITIVDNKGVIVWKRSAAANNTNINTASWASGEYYVIIRDADKKAITQKLIIQH